MEKNKASFKDEEVKVNLPVETKTIVLQGAEDGVLVGKLKNAVEMMREREASWKERMGSLQEQADEEMQALTNSVWEEVRKEHPEVTEQASLDIALAEHGIAVIKYKAEA